MDPHYSADKFFTALLRIPGWDTMPITEAAQAVQISGFPDAYAKHEPLATALVDHIADCHTAQSGSDRGARVVAAAKRWLGTPYVFAGGDKNGPTTGTDPGIGFDCSGLTLHAWAQVGAELPHAATEQSQLGTPIPRAAAQPGDLIFFHTPGDPPGYMHHVGIYLGNGQMIHAPTSGDVVKISRVFGDQYWETEIADIRRY